MLPAPYYLDAVKYWGQAFFFPLLLFGLYCLQAGCVQVFGTQQGTKVGYTPLSSRSLCRSGGRQAIESNVHSTSPGSFSFVLTDNSLPLPVLLCGELWAGASLRTKSMASFPKVTVHLC